MIKVRPIVEPHIRWIIGKGLLDVSKDKWPSATLIQSYSQAMLKDFLNCFVSPMIENIKSMLGQDFYEIRANNIKLSGEEDFCVWEESYSGLFSISSALDLLRHKGPKTHLA